MPYKFLYKALSCLSLLSVMVNEQIYKLLSLMGPSHLLNLLFYCIKVK